MGITITVFGLIIGLISGLLGIIAFFENKIKLLKFLYYNLAIKIFNRQAMEFNFFIVHKYSSPPNLVISNEIFKDFQEEIDKNNFQLKKKFIRPESLDFFIKRNKGQIRFDINVKIDEEKESLEIIGPVDSTSYNLILSISPLRLYWKDLEVINDLTHSIEKMNYITKSKIFNNQKPENFFFVCNITRDFYIKKDKISYEDKLSNSNVIIDKKKITIKGTDIINLRALIKKYYVKLH